MSDQEEKDKKLLDYEYEPLQQDISLARLHRSHSSSEHEGVETKTETETDDHSELPVAGKPAQQPVFEERRKQRLRKGKEAAQTASEKELEPNQEPVRRSKAGKWIFRLAIVPLLCILATFGGMVAGFVVLGKGSVADALNVNTWTHLFQLVFG